MYLKQKLKDTKGITLIALVITIVVLIILATVTINIVINGGIFSAAKEARLFQANAEKYDQEKVDEAVTKIEEATGVEISKWEEKVEKKLPASGAGSKTDKPVADTPENEWSDKVIAIKGRDAEENKTKVPLPERFYYVGGDIDSGIVISDNEQDAYIKDTDRTTYEQASNLVGNQFVWIPVTKSTFVRTAFDTNTGEPTTGLSSDFIEPKTGTGGYTSEESEYNTMKTQVLKYGGFYIGRYEAGVNHTELRTFASEDEEVVIKKGVAPYNWVPWGASMTDIDSLVVTTVDDTEVKRHGAVYLSKNMYKNSSIVTSTLCYGVQWDSICRYIGSTNAKKGITMSIYDNIRTGGVDVSFKNIYDLSENSREWTMETNTNERVARAGYSYGSSNDQVFTRNWSSPENCNKNYSFRVALYIK